MQKQSFWIHQKFFHIDGPERLLQIALYNRINTLAAIHTTGRGWLGACFSITELLTALYFEIAAVHPRTNDQDIIILSKGHAAMMQYACLAGLGILPLEALLQYAQPDGPQAHTDMQTPGIVTNTGSLGQSLSKACGLALGGAKRVWVILGDGELQEGQNYEALMTLQHYGLNNVIPVIDCNGIQSDSAINDIMSIPDVTAMLSSFGLNPLHCDGHNLTEVTDTLRAAAASDRCSAVIARTQKAAGVSFMAADTCEPGTFAWHGPLPNTEAYLRALTELAGQIDNDVLRAECETWLSEQPDETVPPDSSSPTGPSTGRAFADALVDTAPEHTALRVLDADLEKPCRLRPFARTFPDQYLELGIAEQNMVSLAGGLALRGMRPVTNTYASFYRRAFENIYVNATEHTPVLYAGHYAGLCYTTDGKTHQCTGDVAMMRSIPGMQVYYPATPKETAQILEWYLQQQADFPLYIRLHRSPPQNALPDISFIPGAGCPVLEQDGEICLLTSGPHMTAAAIQAARACGSVDVHAVSTLRYLAGEYAAGLCRRYSALFVAEELINVGGLYEELCAACTQLDEQPVIHHRAVDDFTFSTRDPQGLYRHFGLDAPSLLQWLRDLQ